MCPRQTARNAAGATLYQSAYAYNGRGWLTDLRNQSQQTGTLSEFGSASSPMAYDGAGNLTGLTATMPTTVGGIAGYPGNVAYAYDNPANADPATKRGQLTSESNPRVSGGGSFDYDNAGNPTQFRGVPQASPTADNQPGGNTYDGNGSPTTYNGLAYTYDAERRLTAIPGKASFSAGYRADGLRAWKSAQQTAPLGQSHAATQTIRYTPPVTYFLYDGSSIIAELDKNGAATAVNTWGPTGLLARQNVSAGTSSVYTYDPSGNVAQRLDGNGNVQGSYAFDAFGKEATNDATPDPYQYGGQVGYYSDSETGLTLCGERYYDNANGRWLTRDPIGYVGGVNLYAFCGNSGVNGIDPDGRVPVGVMGKNGMVYPLRAPWETPSPERHTLDPEGKPVTIGGMGCLINVPGNAETYNGTTHFFNEIDYKNYLADDFWRRHEHWHLVQEQQMGNGYLPWVISGYILTLSHDACPAEIDADNHAGATYKDPYSAFPDTDYLTAGGGV